MQEQALLAFPRSDKDRLRLALRRLEQAAAEQAAAVRQFRETLAELKRATSGLEHSLGDYRDTLDTTAAEVRRAHGAALQLQRAATKMEALG
jgi:ABC-type transporter Mla subunit MlaD